MSKLDSNGQRQESYVYAGGKKIATASPWQAVWTHEDPVTGGHGISITQGLYGADAEFTADGINVGFAEPTQPAPDYHDTKFMEVGGSSGCYVGNPNCVTCFLDSLEVNCGHVAHLLDVGAAKPCPDNDCGPRQITPPPAPQTPLTPPHLVPHNPYSPFDPNIEQPIHSVNWTDYLLVLLRSFTDPLQQNSKTVPFFSVAELRDEFKKLLSNQECADFVSALIRETESKMRDSQRLDLGSDPLNFEDLFENIAGQGGYVLVGGLKIDGTAVNGTIAGGIWTGDAQAQIRTRSYFTDGPAKVVAASLYDNRRNYLASAFHETFHHLAKFVWGATDADLGRTSFKITGDTQGLPGDNGTVLQWSSYFNEQLMQKCMPDQRMFGRRQN